MTTIIGQFENGSWFAREPAVLVKHDDGSYEVQSAFWYLEERDQPQFEVEGDLYPGPEYPRFSSAKAALRFERIQSLYSTTGDDLDAFNAPSECAPLAYASCDREASRWGQYLHAACVNQHRIEHAFYAYEEVE